MGAYTINDKWYAGENFRAFLRSAKAFLTNFINTNIYLKVVFVLVKSKTAKVFPMIIPNEPQNFSPA